MVYTCLMLYLCVVPLLAVSGILKGFDPLVNLVLDNTIEYLRGK
jgi:hypothetical protein